MATTTYNNNGMPTTRNSRQNNTIYWAIGIGVAVLALLAFLMMRSNTANVSSDMTAPAAVSVPADINPSSTNTNMSGAGTVDSNTIDTNTVPADTNSPEQAAPNPPKQPDYNTNQ